MPAPENVPKGTAGMMGTVFRWLVRKPASKAEPGVNPLEDPRSAIAFGNAIIFIGIGSFLFWASLAPLDEGVPSTGVVVVESHRKIVAHLTGGTVAEVKVRENQLVREGDVLLTLDATRAQTAYTSTLNEYIAAAAKLARLTAEQTFADRIVFPEDVLAYAREAGRMDLIQAQEQIFRIRRQALTNEQAILHENLSASQSQASGARQQLAARQQQAALLTDELGRLRPLVEEGYAPRTKLFEQERQIAELASVTSDIQARLAKEVSTSAELRLRILQRRQEFLRDVESLVADSSREAANLREKLRDAALELERTTIQAPVSGQVVALQVTTPGGIITPGAHILEIVPQGDRLLLDVQVPVHLIARVQPGLTTDIRFTAFTDEPYLTVEGKVQSISTDRHEPQGGQQPPYYLARVEVTEKGLRDLRGRQIRPGMAADAVIKSGERSFLAYMMRPMAKHFFKALQEP